MAPGHILAVSLTALSLAPMACGDETLGEVVVELRTPTTPDPFKDVVKVRLRATGTGMTEVKREVDRSATTVALPPLPYGEGRVITVEGLDKGGSVVSRGSSASFGLTRHSPQSVAVFFARRERFSLVKARLATGRYDHTASALTDGRVVIAAGRISGGGLTASVEIYDPTAGRLSSSPALKRARAGHAAVAAGGVVVIVAGEGAPGSVELYDPTAGTIAELTLSVPRTGHTASPLPGGNVLVVGGVDGKGKPVAAVEIIDPQKKQVRAGPQPGPGQVGHAAAALSDGRVLIAGGRKTPAGKISDEAKLYQPSGSGSWANASKLPGGRTGAIAVRQSSGEVLIVGGEDDKGPVREAITFAGGASAKSGKTSVDRQHHAVAPLESATLVAGGSGTGRAELFSSGVFRDAGDLVRQRERFTLTPLPDGAALAVGGLAGGAISDVEIFVP